jgi:diaminopimelate decarboxylase
MSDALAKDIGQVNLESEEEGVELAALAAARGMRAVATLRVNPDVDAGTHATISTGKAENQFGVPYDGAAAIYARLSLSSPVLFGEIRGEARTLTAGSAVRW